VSDLTRRYFPDSDKVADLFLQIVPEVFAEKNYVLVNRDKAGFWR
jgi:hypothetical protein